MKKTMLILGGAMAVVGLISGCAMLGGADKAIDKKAELKKFREGANNARTIDPSGNPPIDAVGKSTSIVYGKAADSILQYINAVEGTEAQRMYSTEIGAITVKNQDELNTKKKEIARKIYFLCNADTVTDKTWQDATEAKKTEILDNWYKTNTDKSDTLIEGNAVNTYIEFVDKLKMQKTDDAKNKLINDRNINVEYAKEIEKGKAIFDARMKTQDSNFSIDNKIVELTQTLQQATGVLKELSVAIQKDPKAIIVNPFGTPDEKTQARKVVGVMNTVKDQGKYSVEGLDWMLDKYMAMRELDKLDKNLGK